MKKIKDFLVTLFWRILFLIVIIIFIPLWTIIIILASLAFILAIPFWFLMGNIVYKELFSLFDSIESDLSNLITSTEEKTK